MSNIIDTYLIENMIVQLDYMRDYVSILRGDAMAGDVDDTDIVALDVLECAIADRADDLAGLVHMLDAFGVDLINKVQGNLGHPEQLTLDFDELNDYVDENLA